MKKQLPLIVGIGVPVFMIIVIILIVYIPQILLRPVTDFVYSATDQGYWYDGYGDTYGVVDGRLTKKFRPRPVSANDLTPKEEIQYPVIRLLLYDAFEDKSKEITFEEGRRFMLDSKKESPDGFVFIGNGSSYSGSFFGIFGSSYDPEVLYIAKDNITKKIDSPAGPLRQYNYNNNFKFIGWVQ